MNQNEQEILLAREISLGEAHQVTWDNFVKPFFDRKSEELFEAFKSCDTRDKEGLQLLKMQLNALESLQVHFMHFIETGVMASQTLNSIIEGKNND